MLRNTFSLTLGIIIGATLGIIIDDKTKNKIKNKICKRAKNLCDSYTVAIQEGKAKIKNSMQESTSS